MDLTENSLNALCDFFNHHHDKLLCTASKDGIPNASLMGTPRMSPDGVIEFQISDLVSVTRDNIEENGAVMFILYEPGPRARDYFGARIYAEVFEILSTGEKLDNIRESIRARFGDEKADELQVTISCRITRVRPVVDRGQQWNSPPFENE